MATETLNGILEEIADKLGTYGEERIEWVIVTKMRILEGIFDSSRQKICPKCFKRKYGQDDFCSDCGSSVVAINPPCSNGHPVGDLYFEFRMFPPWGKSLNTKYCPTCGVELDEKAIRKAIKAAADYGTHTQMP